MSSIKIETLTPVHVGSGNMLFYNTDFVQVKIKGEIYIAIISAEKVWNLLGEQHMDNWLEAIANRENLKEFLKRFAPEAKSDDYAKRRMPARFKIKDNDSLKECIHNGMGLPYIPGTSIKGAIRTAVLASLASDVQDREKKIDLRKTDDSPNNKNIKAIDIERELFANNVSINFYPNADVFRFIHIGDAYFEKDTEIATRLINLNFRKNDDSLWDDSKPQIVEAIKKETASELKIKIAKEYYDFVNKKYPQVGKMPVTTIGDLFRLVNEHTRKLTEDEINYWSDIDKTDGEDYVVEMQNILEKINHCEAGKSCILRIGHASGWRFITGAWTEDLTNFKDVVVPASRPSNWRYEEYDFPKSRRLDDNSYIFGFVKLTVID